ncbi:MAG TPA: hypothetical protein PLV96_00075 [Methanoregulaceae archaeon]|nr:hypothetical protein [Methanoregulaceae archaeon]
MRDVNTGIAITVILLGSLSTVAGGILVKNRRTISSGRMRPEAPEKEDSQPLLNP